MRERFWLMLGIVLVLVVVGFASMGTRGPVTRGRVQSQSLVDQMTELPTRIFANLRDMTRTLAESLSGLQQGSAPVTAAEATRVQPQEPAKHQ